MFSFSRMSKYLIFFCFQFLVKKIMVRVDILSPICFTLEGHLLWIWDVFWKSVFILLL